MDSAGEMDTWAEAARKATFPFYELSEPSPDYRWAGGYGWRSTNEIIELGIHHDVGESEVIVSTSVVEEDTAMLASEPYVRFRALGALTAEAFGYDKLEPLPAVLEFAVATATIRVDDADQVFEGIDLRKNGELLAWSGHATVGDVRISVTVRPGAPDGLSLSPCTDWSMSDAPRRLT